MNWKLSIVTSFLSLFFFTHCTQEIKDQVPFLENTPVIDGQLDATLATLSKRHFNYIWQFNNPVTDTVPVTYRMAYTPTHLYLYLEVEADSINYRNRGFINGDGFKYLIGNPQEGSLTNEFYDMAFSPSRDKNYWARKRIWDYNHQQGHGKDFTRATLFEEGVSNGKCGFEALIAWGDIDPYHPWFMDKIGHNLYFAKAIGDTITNGYAAVEDEGIWDEELPKRAITLIDFEKPKKVQTAHLLLKLQQRNRREEMPLQLNVMSISNKSSTKNIALTIFDQKKELVSSEEVEIKIEKDFKREIISINTEKLSPGKYTLLATSSKDTLMDSPFVVFPNIDFNTLQIELHGNPQGLSLGTIHTLLFKLLELQKKLVDLKSYESGENVFDYFQAFNAAYGSFKEGIDPYDGLTAPYRRAFLSKTDDTYQPYSIKLPENYDPNNKYPLLVFLHGSGRDEQGILNSPRSNGDFIELAPLARDIYYCYSSDSSQTDILEAIEDVSKHFPVDEDKIVIGGFSMGGYGALRTYYEHPELYKGVAVFAGHPHLASNWLEGEHPNFLLDEYLADFSKVPVFIYHGRKDGSLPVHKAGELVQKLKEGGAIVTSSIVEDKGHEYPDEKTNAKYFNWLKSIF